MINLNYPIEASCEQAITSSRDRNRFRDSYDSSYQQRVLFISIEGGSQSAGNRMADLMFAVDSFGRTFIADIRQDHERYIVPLGGFEKYLGTIRAFASSKLSRNQDEQDEKQEKSIRFLAQLYRMLKDRDEDTAMRFVYSYFYSLRNEQNYSLCDRILDDVDVPRLSPVVLIAFLTITAPLRKYLPNRKVFYAKSRAVIQNLRGPDAASRLLVGLE